MNKSQETFVFVFFSLIIWVSSITKCVAQDYPPMDETLKEFKKLDSITNWHFKGNRVQTLKEKDIEYLLNIYFQQVDLLPHIKGGEGLKFNFYKSRAAYFKILRVYGQSNKLYLKALEQFKTIKNPSRENKLELYFAINDMTDNYVKIDKIDSAMYYHKNRIKFTKKHIPERTSLASAYNNLGIHFGENLHQIDSAMFYFQKAKSIMELETNPKLYAFMGSIRDNIANIHLDRNEFVKAKELFEENFKFYKLKKFHTKIDSSRWTKSGIQLAETNLKLKNLNHAKAILKKVDTILSGGDFFRKKETKIQYLQALVDLHTMNGKHEIASAFLEEKIQLQQILDRSVEARQSYGNTQLRTLIIARLNKNFEAKQRELLSKRKEERYKFWSTILILMLAISILIIFLIIYKQRLFNSKQKKLLAERELEMVSLENNLLNEKINIRKKDLSDFALNLTQNQEWVQILLKDLEIIKESKGRSKAKKLIELEKMVQQKATFDDSTKSFHEKVDQLSNEFYAKLYKQFPDLTKSDIRLCSMIRLGYDIYEIALLQNIHFNSVYQNRYRLKKKLKLSQDQDIDLFLKRF